MILISCDREGVACDNQDPHARHLVWAVEQFSLIINQVETHVQLLQELERLLALFDLTAFSLVGQEIVTVKRLQLIPAEIQSFQEGNGGQALEDQGWIHHHAPAAEVVRRQVQLHESLEERHVLRKGLEVIRCDLKDLEIPQVAQLLQVACRNLVVTYFQSVELWEAPLVKLKVVKIVELDVQLFQAH